MAQNLDRAIACQSPYIYQYKYIYSKLPHCQDTDEGELTRDTLPCKYQIHQETYL